MSVDDQIRWQSMWLEEYKSIRSESEQARNAQQTILQWSLGSFAAVIAGSLVMFQGAGRSASYFSGEVGTLLLFLFGVGLPGLGFFSYLTWWGEFLRMERAGRYIRGLELAAGRMVESPDGALPPPLCWEHFLASSITAAGGRRGTRVKQMVGYIGASGIYFGFSFSSLMLFASFVAGHSYHLGLWGGWVRALSLAWTATYVGFFITITFYLRNMADRQSRQGVSPLDSLPVIGFVPVWQQSETAFPSGKAQFLRQRSRSKHRLSPLTKVKLSQVVPLSP